MKTLNNINPISILVDENSILIEFEKRSNNETTKEHINKILDHSSQLISDIRKKTEKLFLSDYVHAIPEGLDIQDNISLVADIIEQSSHKLVVECNVFRSNSNQFLALSFWAFEAKN